MTTINYDFIAEAISKLPPRIPDSEIPVAFYCSIKTYDLLYGKAEKIEGGLSAITGIPVVIKNYVPEKTIIVEMADKSIKVINL